MKIEYIISPNIELRFIDEKYFIKDHFRKKTYETTASIYFLISYFEKANYIENYIQETSEKSQINYEELEKIVYPFFKKLLRRNLLIEPSEVNLVENFVAQSLAVNDIIDEKYQIESILKNTKNTMYVLLVRELQTNEQRVMKLALNNKPTEERKYKKRKSGLKNEYKMLKMVDDSAIVKPIHFHKSEEFTYLILEYVENAEGLNRKITKEDLTDTEKIKLIEEILRAFSTIFEAGVFHGDVHYKNIMVNENNEIKIIDFGFSDYRDKNRKRYIANGAMHYFIPPENVAGHSFNKMKNITSKRGEVYQLGVIMYFIFYNKLPFVIESWNSLRDQILSGISTLPENNLYSNLLLKALSVKPKERHKNTVELYADWQNTSAIINGAIIN